MGTNYYAVKRKPSISEPIHIGKSSVGWLFCFQYQNRNEYGEIPCVWRTYNQVKDWLKKYTTGEDSPYVIINEYDEIISYDDFIDLVDTKQKDERNKKNPDNFEHCDNVDGYRFVERDFG